jgi:hypothetical protein
MVSQLLLGSFALVLPSAVLSQSFSVPFQKVQTYGQTVLPPTKTHHRGVAQIGEVDQEVVPPLLSQLAFYEDNG